MPKSQPEFIVIAEAPADARIACDLADRVLCEQVDWIEKENLTIFRRWRGVKQTSGFTRWDGMKPEDFQRAGLPRYRRRQDPEHTNKFDAGPARQFIRLAQLLRIQNPNIEGLLLIRDLDKGHAAARKQSLHDAREAEAKDLPVVIGVEDPKREAWVLNGFEPQSDAETDRKQALRTELGFDPCARADRLDAARDTSKKSAKRILNKLTGNSKNRERPCWQETPLETLRDRGENTGLTDYLAEVEERLVPLFQHRRAE